MASIQLLPAEILAEAITYHVSQDFCPPTNLLAVCKFWRNTILNTPSAWSFLTIPCVSGASDTKSLVDTWIERSGAVPLFVRLMLMKADSQPPVPVLQSSSKLIQAKDRIREMHIYDATEWNLYNLDFLWPAPQLQMLHISPLKSSIKAIPQLELLELPLFLRHTPQAPNLQYLRLQNCNFDKPTCTLTNLRELELINCSANSDCLQQVLTSNPLTSLTIVRGVSSNIIVPPLGSIILEHLRKLHLHDCLSCFCDASVPSLLDAKFLQIHFSRKQLNSLLALFSSEMHPLKYLDLILVSHSEMDLTLPKLEKLETLRLATVKMTYHPLSVLKHKALHKFSLDLAPCPDPKIVADWRNLFDFELEWKVTIIPNQHSVVIEGKKEGSNAVISQ